MIIFTNLPYLRAKNTHNSGNWKENEVIKEAVQYLYELGLGWKPYRESIGGIEYSSAPLSPVKPPRPVAMEIHRLQGFVDFVTAPNESIDKTHVLIHVVSPWEVRYVSTLATDFRDREFYAVVKHSAEQAFRLGQYMDSEAFNISIQTLFADSTDAFPNDKARLLELVGTASSVLENTVADDGVTQAISVKAGVTLKTRATITNPFTLAPHRTFPEVQQPRSPFILRVKQASENAPPIFALFESDNGAWQLDAVDGIAEWLREKLTETDIPILA